MGALAPVGLMIITGIIMDTYKVDSLLRVF